MLSVNLYWRTIVLPFLNDSMMYVPFPLSPSSLRWTGVGGA